MLGRPQTIKVKKYLLIGCGLTTTFLLTVARPAMGAEPALNANGHLAVDSTFTKVIAGPVVTDVGVSWTGCWGDYNGDGWIDLAVANTGRNFLYRNQGDGSFLKITSGPVVEDYVDAGTAIWGDYNNDGFPDLFVPSWSGITNCLYRNNGTGAFVKVTNAPATDEGGQTSGAAWFDYNQDGFLDLLVANFVPNVKTFLYRNNGDGIGFTKMNSILAGPLPDSTGLITGVAGSDYDADGDLDLFLSRDDATSLFFRNTGDSKFEELAGNSVGGFVDRRASGGAFADYDNDGDLDLYLIDGAEKIGTNYLYLNTGSGVFSRVETADAGMLTGQPGNSPAAAWADYDNDGFLDLFVSNFGSGSGGANSLYRNNGNGSFSKVLTGNIVTDTGKFWGCSWGDYDNNGFPDLFVATGALSGKSSDNVLYRNNGNSNNWLKIKLRGTISNRDAVGVKVRIKTTIGGRTFWQLRELSPMSSQSDPRPNFGLGDAKKAETVRVEWPSGKLQEFRDVLANQIFDVVEPDTSRNFSILDPRQSASIGATVTFRVVGNGPLPFYARWSHSGTNIPGGDSTTLILTNITLARAGEYTARIEDFNGAVSTVTAHLEVYDPFSKITEGEVVNDRGIFWSAAWADYDGDGFIDLVASTTGKNHLYRNRGDGTFSRIISGPVVEDTIDGGGVWGDYDNDGAIDLFVANYSDIKDFLYHNSGDGTFTRNLTPPVATEGGKAAVPGWADYNNDGHLDLVVSNLDPKVNTFLYRNNGDGRSFTKMTQATAGDVPADSGWCNSVGWADYDNDGDLDLYIPRDDPTSLFYRNRGDGTFERLASNDIGDFVDRPGSTSAFGDYDNDGDLDMFITLGAANSGTNYLYRNNGAGRFERMSTAAAGRLTEEFGNAPGAAWADYDNDGHLDLFLTGFGPGLTTEGTNSLHHNNGDGTFTSITTGSLVSDRSKFWGCAWGDYDNNGFPDIFLTSGALSGRAYHNALFRNKGNSNRWLKVELVGTVSNRSAIGAKVRVKATIRGRTFWQLREIEGGNRNQNDLRPNFGLGDATAAETVRVEWPSGIVQEFQNVAPNRILTVIEPPKLKFLARSMERVELELIGGAGFEYEVESSSDLITWRHLTTVFLTRRGGLIEDHVNLPTINFYRARRK
jgi:hypothetical protein